MTDAQALHVWKIQDGGETFWVVAASPDDARAVFAESGVPDTSDWDRDPPRIAPVDDARELRFDDDGEKVSKTCGEWAKEGRGYLCGTVW